MPSVTTLATILLLERLVAVSFMAFVLKRQLELFRYPIDLHIRNFRRILFALSLGLLLGNVIPIAIDLFAILTDVQKVRGLTKIGVLYAVSNATTAVIASVFIWLLYKVAANSPPEDSQLE